MTGSLPDYGGAYRERKSEVDLLIDNAMNKWVVTQNKDSNVINSGNYILVPTNHDIIGLFNTIDAFRKFKKWHEAYNKVKSWSKEKRREI